MCWNWTRNTHAPPNFLIEFCERLHPPCPLFTTTNKQTNENNGYSARVICTQFIILLPKSCPTDSAWAKLSTESGRMQWIPGASCSYALLLKWEKQSLIGNAEIKNVLLLKTVGSNNESEIINSAHETTWRSVFPVLPFLWLPTILVLMCSLSHSIFILIQLQ